MGVLRVGTASLVASVGAAAVIVGLVVYAILPIEQLGVLGSRITGGESLSLRLSLWRHVGLTLLENPRVMLLGLGPDYTTRLVDAPFVRDMLRSAGQEQAALDSGYLWLSVNFGLPCAFLVIIAVFTVFMRAVRGIPAREPFKLVVVVGLLVWASMSITQQPGISKPLFALAQLIVIAECLMRRTNHRGLSTDT
jgi:hypothetical protein